MGSAFSSQILFFPISHLVCETPWYTVFVPLTTHTPISTVKQIGSLQITHHVVLFFFFKAYVNVGTHLHFLDKSMQFKWVPKTYAFIKKLRKLHKHPQVSSLLIFLKVYPLIVDIILFYHTFSQIQWSGSILAVLVQSYEEKHFCKIILKLSYRLQRRCSKFFLFLDLVAILFSRVEQFCSNFGTGPWDEYFCDIISKSSHWLERRCFFFFFYF